MNCEVMQSTMGVPFNTIENGDVFVYVGSDGSLRGPYMKLECKNMDPNNPPYNATLLSEGFLVKFGQYDMVVEVPHTLQWQRPF